MFSLSPHTPNLSTLDLLSWPQHRLTGMHSEPPAVTNLSHQRVPPTFFPGAHFWCPCSQLMRCTQPLEIKGNTFRCGTASSTSAFAGSDTSTSLHVNNALSCVCFMRLGSPCYLVAVILSQCSHERPGR